MNFGRQLKSRSSATSVLRSRCDLPQKPAVKLNGLHSNLRFDHVSRAINDDDNVIARRKAAKLRRRQRDLQNELGKIQGELSRLGDADNHDEGAQLPPEIRELLREAGVLGSEAGISEDAVVSPEEAEKLARLLENGGKLPELLFRENNLCEPESAESFLKRMNAIFERFTYGTKGSRHGKTKIPEVEEMFPAMKLNLPEEPPLHGDLPGNIPAPDLPLNIQNLSERVFQILFVLRRAHLESRKPTAALAALYNKKLLDPMRITLHDPWFEIQGIHHLKTYMSKLERAGAEVELYKVYARCAKYEPLPSWKVYVDAFLSLPYPDWVDTYFDLHWEEEATLEGLDEPRLSNYWKDSRGRAVRELGLERHQSPPAGETLYPRHAQSTSFAPPQENAYCMYMSHHDSLRTTKIRWLSIDLSSADRYRVLHDCPASYPGGYSTFLPRAETFLGSRDAFRDMPSTWDDEDEGDDEDKPLTEFTFDPNTRDLDSITSKEAEYVLRKLLGKDFERTIARLPKPGRNLGRAKRPPVRNEKWKDETHMSVAVTIVYHICPETARVTYIQIEWGSMFSKIKDARESYDIYMKKIRGLTWRP